MIEINYAAKIKKTNYSKGLTTKSIYLDSYHIKNVLYDK